MYEEPFAQSIADRVRRTYAGMVLTMDEAVGNLSSALASRGMWNNSVLVVSSDNGGWMGYGGVNMPYRGHKTTLWEGALRPRDPRTPALPSILLRTSRPHLFARAQAGSARWAWSWRPAACRRARAWAGCIT